VNFGLTEALIDGIENLPSYDSYYGRKRFDGAFNKLNSHLSHPAISASLAQSPSEWLAANKSHILTILPQLFDIRAQLEKYGGQDFGRYIFECIDKHGRIYLVSASRGLPAPGHSLPFDSGSLRTPWCILHRVQSNTGKACPWLSYSNCLSI
jgi:hypothetical protein